jgi:putative restriction endonuclease
MPEADFDDAVRAAAFRFLGDQVQRYGHTVPWTVLTTGFRFDDRPISLMNPQRGIWKPAVLDLPISITTTPEVRGRVRPYDDAMDYADRLLYRYQGTNPAATDNVGLRRVMDLGKPLAYFSGVAKGVYLPMWPAYIVADDPGSLTFTVVVDVAAPTEAGVLRLADEIPRRYAMRVVRQRIHQAAFRERVLTAYGRRCTVCRLRHDQLLDAAHILPDSRPDSPAIVSNGLALCRLHHGAFDGYLMGIRPDLTVEIRQDVMDEVDGPTLVHALQGVHGGSISVPRREDLRPDAEYLDERYQVFRAAG